MVVDHGRRATGLGRCRLGAGRSAASRSPESGRGHPARTRPSRTPAGLPAGIASVLSVLSSSAVVLDSNDRVLRASAAARAFGLVKGDRLMVSELLALARQVRRDGEIREGEFEVSGPRFGGRTTSFAVRVAPLGAGGRRRRPGPAAGRGPDREPPGGRGPAGLRGQRQPRAQDAGRRAGPAGRDGRGRRRRPRGGPPVRRADAAGGISG